MKKIKVGTNGDYFIVLHVWTAFFPLKNYQFNVFNLYGIYFIKQFIWNEKINEIDVQNVIKILCSSFEHKRNWFQQMVQNTKNFMPFIYYRWKLYEWKKKLEQLRNEKCKKKHHLTIYIFMHIMNQNNNKINGEFLS